MKTYPIEKFGIYSTKGGLNEVDDTKRIQSYRLNLSRKPLQFRIIKKDLIVYLSGIEIAKFNISINNEESDIILKYLQRFIRLKIVGGQLYLSCHEEPIVKFDIFTEHKTQKFYIELETL